MAEKRQNKWLLQKQLFFCSLGIRVSASCSDFANVFKMVDSVAHLYDKAINSFKDVGNI